MLPPFSAILLWKSYGGVIYPSELLTLTFGHLLNAGLTIGLAAAVSALTEHPSTAAILTLSITVGTWIVNFFGAIQGGLWERAAGYTPAAIVADFQHGLVRLDTLLTAILLTLTGLSLAAVWMRLGVSVKRRTAESLLVAVLAVCAVFACTFARATWDTSESRGNSFPVGDEQALRRIRTPLRIEAHLAQEDPRRLDLERYALSKLRRILPHLQVEYVSATSIGLFEQNSAGYGEIWYHLGGRKSMSRVTSAEGVLEAIYSLAGVPEPPKDEESVFRGHPLATQAKGAGVVFYALWPGIFLAGAIFVRRRFQ